MKWKLQLVHKITEEVNTQYVKKKKNCGFLVVPQYYFAGLFISPQLALFSSGHLGLGCFWVVFFLGGGGSCFVFWLCLNIILQVYLYLHNLHFSLVVI